MKSLFDNQTWLTWLMAAATGSLSLVSFAYATFELKADATSKEARFEKRLDNIDAKLDRLLERQRK